MGVSLPEGGPRLSAPLCSTGVRLCTTTTEGDTTTGEGDTTTGAGDTTTGEGDTTTGEGDTTTLGGWAEGAVAGADVELGGAGGVFLEVAAGTYKGTEDMGLPMTGEGAGEGGLLTGLCGLGGTTGGGASLGLDTLMLRVDFATAGGSDGSGGDGEEGVRTGEGTAGGEEGVTADGFGGAGLIGGTVMEDFTTTGGAAEGAVFTTTVAVDLAGSAVSSCTTADRLL